MALTSAGATAANIASRISAVRPQDGNSLRRFGRAIIPVHPSASSLGIQSQLRSTDRM